EETIKDRILGRRLCPTCQRSYHQSLKPPHLEGFCDDCEETELIQRKDDNEASLNTRLGLYASETLPLKDLFANRGLLVQISGEGAAEDIAQEAIVKLSHVLSKDSVMVVGIAGGSASGKSTLTRELLE